MIDLGKVLGIAKKTVKVLAILLVIGAVVGTCFYLGKEYMEDAKYAGYTLDQYDEAVGFRQSGELYDRRAAAYPDAPPFTSVWVEENTSLL